MQGKLCFGGIWDEQRSLEKEIQGKQIFGAGAKCTHWDQLQQRQSIQCPLSLASRDTPASRRLASVGHVGQAQEVGVGQHEPIGCSRSP